MNHFIDYFLEVVRFAWVASVYIIDTIVAEMTKRQMIGWVAFELGIKSILNVIFFVRT